MDRVATRTETRVYCTFCECIIPTPFGTDVADRFVYYVDGGLKYIALAHERCARDFGGPDWSCNA